MSQNQNRTINQFLQGKSSTVNNYNFSNKNPLQGRLYFSKDINNKKTKVLSPHFERSNNEDNNEKKKITYLIHIKKLIIKIVEIIIKYIVIIIVNI